MKTVIIKKEIEAQQYIPGIGAPDGCTRSHPEVIWSADKKYVYFTFAKLRAAMWMGVEKLEHKPATGPLASSIAFSKEGKLSYYRESLLFAYWSIKSLASVTMNHTPVFLNDADETEVVLFQDYSLASEWIPNEEAAKRFRDTIEFREVNGAYARGYIPHYMEPGDWLLKEKIQDKIVYSVVNNEMFEKMQAS